MQLWEAEEGYEKLKEPLQLCDHPAVLRLSLAAFWACYTRGMSEQLPMPPPGFEALSVQEQIDYVQSLWDQIAANAERIPVPDWHREILEQRLAAYRAGAGDGRSWEDFEKELRVELDQRTKE